jgi:hypothetical protein
MAGDTEHSSATSNTSGDPSIWREIVYADAYGDENTDWRIPSYVKVFADGQMEVFSNYISNNRVGPTLGRPDVNFGVELWFKNDVNRIAGYFLMLYRNLRNGDGKDLVKVRFAAPPNVYNDMAASTYISAYRHVGTVPSDPVTIPIPTPDPDI